MASNKQRIAQLKDWLEWRKKTSGITDSKPKKFSKMDHYKKVNKRYGKNSN
jgi:hypothetical protein|tara:strand:- start:1091 stop:1243 length:153 start_codon:yes stop_codon:yes gene_type:complete